ncbi:MAG: phospholipid carrier-dependent glycosyltransferase [Actinomycetota bacterium]
MQRLRHVLGHPVVAITVVTILAGALRFHDLGDPGRRIFDEVYYSKAGCLAVGYDRETCAVTSEQEIAWADKYDDVGSWVHPPLGKLAIGTGQRVFGPDAFGWRSATAFAGTLTVMLIAWLAFLLWRRAAWAWVAGLLMATEHLSFVQSRIGMLDGLLTFWIVLGLFLLVVDRRWIDRRTEAAAREEESGPRPPTDDRLLPVAGGSVDLWDADRDSTGADPRRPPPPPPGTEPVLAPAFAGPVPSPLWRPWRFAAGIALGCAVATKWSGAFALLAAIVLSLLWERTRRFRAWADHPVRRAVVQEGFTIVLAFAIVPILVYVASYAGYFMEFGFSPSRWFTLQREMLGFSRGLEPLDDKGQPIHGYLSAAWQWIANARPVAYFYTDESGVRREIMAIGNPVVFWTSIVAIPAMAVAWRRARDWIAGFVLVAIGVQYLPWFFISRPKFLFYIAPIAPFLVLAVVWLVRELASWRIEPQEADDAKRGIRPLLPVAVLLVVAAIAAFLWFWPVLTAGELTEQAWRLRIWFDGTTWGYFNWI